MLIELEPLLERRAAERFRTYSSLLEQSRPGWLRQLIREYPGTKAAKEANRLLGN